MTPQKQTEIRTLAIERLTLAGKYLDDSRIKEDLLKAMSEQAEIPGYEDRKMKFGQFENKEFVVLMTDIRKSMDIMKSDNGVVKMFKIFYVYAAVVAKIVDDWKGSATEFLGDGVLNLFPIETIKDDALKHSIQAGWDILEAREQILNPIFLNQNLPTINLGIGIDSGMTIVTRFGYKVDNDLKAFGSCVYNVSRLSKGQNEILVSEKARAEWPSAPDGNLGFSQKYLPGDNFIANRAIKI